MTETGNVWHTETGVRGQIEAGTGSLIRHDDGRATRFTFKKPFNKVPHVQLTPDRGQNPETPFDQFWFYLLGKGQPAVDREGFSVGMFGEVGQEVTFRYVATEIVEEEEVAGAVPESVVEDVKVDVPVQSPVGDSVVRQPEFNWVYSALVPCIVTAVTYTLAHRLSK